MLPSFFLAFLYLVYVIGWAVMSKIAPPLPEEQTGSMSRMDRKLQTLYSPNLLSRCRRR